MGLVGLVWRCGVRALVWEAHQEGFSLDVISWDDVTLQHSFGDHFWRLHDTQWAPSVPKVLIKPSQKPCGTSEEAWLTFVRINIGCPEGVSGGLLWRSPARWSLVCVFAFAIISEQHSDRILHEVTEESLCLWCQLSHHSRRLYDKTQSKHRHFWTVIH